MLIGTFRSDWAWAKPTAVLAAFGVVLTAAYILWMIQRVYLGGRREEYAGFPDADARETAILVPMALLAIFMGILPQYTFDLMNGTLADVVNLFGRGAAMAMGG